MEIFNDTFVPTGLVDVWFSNRTCAACAGTIEPVHTLGEPHYLCQSCGRCYRVEHVRFRPVDPVGCRGCADKSKRECIALLASTFPRFGGTDEAADERV
jgi:hypothetical protein